MSSDVIRTLQEGLPIPEQGNGITSPTTVGNGLEVGGIGVTLENPFLGSSQPPKWQCISWREVLRADQIKEILHSLQIPSYHTLQIMSTYTTLEVELNGRLSSLVVSYVSYFFIDKKMYLFF